MAAKPPTAHNSIKSAAASSAYIAYERCPDIKLATRLLGWTPGVGLDDGLARTIAYFSALVGTTGRRCDAITEAAD